MPAQSSIKKRAPAHFDLNDYSIPHTHVGRTLELLATLDTVRIVDGDILIATHPRSFDRDTQIEDPAHIQALLDYKRAGRAHRAIDRLHHATPSVARLFKLAAERGVHLGALTRGLIELLNTHGAAALEAAVTAALAEDAAHLAAVRHFIDLQRARRKAAPPIPVRLPDDPRVRALSVRPHKLTAYEQLAREGTIDERSDESDAGNADPARDEPDT